MSTVFLSHSSKDKDFVEKLAKDLNNQGIGVWFDKWEIKVGDSIVEKINEGLSKNDYLAVIMSPSSVSSDWVKRELNSSLMKQLKNKSVRILPILYKDCAIPDIIIDLKYADFRHDFSEGIVNLLEVLLPEPKKSLNIEKNNITKIGVKEISEILKEEIRKATFYKRLVGLMFYELSIRIFFNLIKKKNGEVNIETSVELIEHRKELTELICIDIDNCLSLYKVNRFNEIIDKIDNKYKVLIEYVLSNYRIHMKELINHSGFTADMYVKENILKEPKTNYFLPNTVEDEMNFYSYYKKGVFEVIRYVTFLAGTEVYNIITENFSLNFDPILFIPLKKFLINRYYPYDLKNKKEKNKYYKQNFDVTKFLMLHLQEKIYGWEDAEEIIKGKFNPKKYYFTYEKNINFLKERYRF